jgi:hypothetical protein
MNLRDKKTATHLPQLLWMAKTHTSRQDKKKAPGKNGLVLD